MHRDPYHHEDAWTQEVVSYEGQFFTIKDASLKLRPLQRPMPAIWLGADLEPGVRRAARHADSWFPSPRPPPERLAQLVEIYHAELRKRNRSVPAVFPIQRELYLAESHEEAVRQARNFASWHQEHAGDTRASEVNTDRFILGGPRECVEAIRRYVEGFGIGHLVFMIQWPGLSHEKALETISLIGRELVPEFRK